jgi:glucosamine kinase
MTDRLFLGVDGGGTSTRARLRDEAGNLLGEGEAGAGNARLPDGYAQTMKACRQALTAAGLSESASSRVHAGFGLAGTQQDADQRDVLDRPHPFASLTVDTDAYAAWLGAFGGSDGAIIILGTGSCGLAVINDKRVTVGGWGSQISDEGSGANFGRLAIRRAIWAHEGMAPITPFAVSVLEDFDGDPQNAAIWSGEATPGDYAALTPRVFDYAERGDELAAGVARDCAADAAMLIDRLCELGAERVATIGGLFPRIVPWLKPSTRKVLIDPAADATEGAVLMAQRSAAGIGTGRPQ